MELLTHVAEREEKGELAMVLHSLPGQPASESVSGDTPTIKVVAPAVGSKSTVESHRMRNQMLQGVSLEEECKQEAFSRTLLRESQRSAGPRVERLANGLTPGEDALRRFTLWEGGGLHPTLEEGPRQGLSPRLCLSDRVLCRPVCVQLYPGEPLSEYEWASFARSERCLCGIASCLVSPVWLEASSRVDRTSFLWTTFTPTRPRSLPSK